MHNSTLMGVFLVFSLNSPVSSSTGYTQKEVTITKSVLYLTLRSSVICWIGACHWLYPRICALLQQGLFQWQMWSFLMLSYTAPLRDITNHLSTETANYLFCLWDEVPEILKGPTLRVTLRNSFPLVDFGLLPLVAQVHEEEKDLFVFTPHNSSK